MYSTLERKGEGRKETNSASFQFTTNALILKEKWMFLCNVHFVEMFVANQESINLIRAMFKLENVIASTHVLEI